MSQQLYANNAMKRGWLTTQNRVAEQASINGFFTLLDRIQDQSQAQMDFGDRDFAVEYDEISEIVFNHERAFFRGPAFKPRKAIEESSDLPALVSELEIRVD
ncbi:hypothetical protein GGF43_000442 [Coemansia sp. RSA 2618]|nr:hypothetical protein GGF43_000442 [Coemansia sp. RSA 2618]